MKQYLAINLLAESLPELIFNISTIMNQTNCTFETTRMVQLGSKSSLAFLAAGTWDALHKLQTHLTQFCQEQQIQCNIARTSKTAPQPNKLLCYTLELTTHEQAGILYDITRFLVVERIEIEEIYASTYRSRSGTLMSQLIIRLLIPADLILSDLRERFLLLCESLNLDAALEPDRG
jgi:glycine cleavage system transcriptional repressor